MTAVLLTLGPRSAPAFDRCRPLLHPLVAKRYRGHSGRRSFLLRVRRMAPGAALLRSLALAAGLARTSAYAQATVHTRASGLMATLSPTAPIRDAATRDANVAQYLVDLHDDRATFDFCGGMDFQLVLTDRLRTKLAAAAGGSGAQPVVYGAATARMAQMPGYGRSAFADDVTLFHGREVRSVPDAAGGMNFVLQLSASADDPDGWTEKEITEYDGWGHDQGRNWRKGETLPSEGYSKFHEQFGPTAYSLHHRFYLHLDNRNRLWLSAEDGCEGVYPK
ncbi:hypothetical protein M885DRAFT_310312 [Pelagophyceae sp. CCMP2097]|nr:hypothetical protein M885DRAFT_310312 [Pelagophyceae sp. CCMP2097]